MAAASPSVLLLLLFLPLVLSLAIAVAASQPNPNKKVIEETCKCTTVHSALCVEALTAVDMGGAAADARGLAAVAVRLAERNATGTAEEVARLRDEAEARGAAGEGEEECLGECEELYEDTVEQLEGAAAALEAGKFADAAAAAEAALAGVRVCQDGCRAVPDHKNVLTKRNGDVSRLCSIAISIIRLLH
ncbi:uncharacterized protein LOC109709347 [Ananas comosus]|uniref:Pectinesterase inhibitor n=1 Tax=Ananas comosus TaxID=4615 RepID=A0A199VJR3_ANACO|nr:uncharacterized protein LOC109709347 [Ananas comosus]OAY77329.1 Pectinesterase inhibitor [Ananas comosus]